MKWTIGRKLFLGFASITILAIIVAGAALINFRKIDEASRTVKNSTAIAEQILEIRREEKNYILWYEQDCIDTLTEYMAHLDEHIAIGKRELHNEALITDLDGITASLKTYKALFDKVIQNHELVEKLMSKMRLAGRDVQDAAGERENAGELIISVLEARREEKNYQIYRGKALRAGEKTYQEKFKDAIERLKTAGRNDPKINELADQYALDFNDLVEAYKNTDELVSHMRDEGRTIQETAGELEGHAWASIEAAQAAAAFIMPIVLIIAVLASVILAVIIARMITIPLRQLVSVSQDIAEGNLTRNVDLKTEDEVGRLAASYQQMVESLRGLVGQTQDTAERVSATSQELSSSAQEMNATAEDIASTVQQIAAGSAKQAETTEKATKIIEDISTTIKENASAAQTASAASLTATEMAQGGRDATRKTVEKMEQIDSVIRESADSISGLRERSQQIGRIVGMITGFANQTNLLSLNAAIEAARAGESGRGFAVVAEEVRKLAEGSKKSAEEIAGLIEEIQEHTEKAVASADSGSKEVTGGMEVVKETATVFEEIIKAVEETGTMNQQVASGSLQIVESIERIIKSMEEISATAEENASAVQEVSGSTEEQTASMEEMVSSSQELADMAVKLAGLTSKFKVGVREDA